MTPRLGAMLTLHSRRDHRLMRRVNRWRAPRWIRLWMMCATRGGDGWLWYTLAADAAALRRRAALPGGGRRGAGGGLGITHFPQIEEGHRPQAALRHRTALLGHPAAAGPVLVPLGPYHHGLRGGVSLSRFYPELAAGLLFCAVSVAASRILLGMHFLSDVLAGAAIGGILAYTATWIIP